jgi:hypothetical protein
MARKQKHRKENFFHLEHINQVGVNKVSEYIFMCCIYCRYKKKIYKRI